MRFEIADASHIGYVHLMTIENLKDQDNEIWKVLYKNPDFWLNRFSNPNFFALVGLHGKKPVGLVAGILEKHDLSPTCVVETFFLRRSWRGKIKPLRRMALALNDFLSQNNIKRVEMEADEKNTSKLLKRKFKTSRIYMERNF